MQNAYFCSDFYRFLGNSFDFPARGLGGMWIPCVHEHECPQTFCLRLRCASRALVEHMRAARVLVLASGEGADWAAGRAAGCCHVAHGMSECEKAVGHNG